MGIFVTGRAGTPFRKLYLKRTEAGTAFRNFFPVVGFTKLVVSCYPTALFFKQTSIFCILVKEKFPPPPIEFLVTMCIPEPVSLEK
jgi:hypothetical protein